MIGIHNSLVRAVHPITGELEDAVRIIDGDTTSYRFPDGQVFPTDRFDIEIRAERGDLPGKVEDALEQRTTVVLIHLPTRKSASEHVNLRHVRAWAESATRAFRSQVADAKDGDFMVVEIRGDIVRVTSLDHETN